MKKKHRYVKKRWTKGKIITIFIFSLIFLMIFGVGFYGVQLLKKIPTTEISDKDEDLGITDEIKDKVQEIKTADEVINIALFGLDQRNIKENGRSDAIMVLSIDKAHKKLKVFSIMRDTYVLIDGHGSDKINHAYAFGGPEAAIKTINKNFGLNIKDFVTVNFFGMEKIIDAMGGVDINIKKAEVPVINDYIKETAKLQKKTAKLLTKSGMQHLTGIQAVAYTRDRYTGNGDFERTERQRRVLSALVDSIKKQGLTKYPGMVNQLAEHVNTSFTAGEMISLGTDLFKMGDAKLEQERFPTDNYGKNAMINGVWYFKFDKEATKKQIFDYLYNDIKPTAK